MSVRKKHSSAQDYLITKGLIMMMAFGMFIFSMHSLAYQTLNKQTSWRHGSQPRVGARPARQFLGPGDESISLPGWIAPGQVGSGMSLSMLRDMANTGKAYSLVDGLGVFHGVYIIESVTETGSHFNRFGQARRIEFNVELSRIDDDLQDGMLGDLSLPRFGPTGASLGDIL